MAKLKIPAKLGERIDYIYNLRAERLALQKQYDGEIETLKAVESEVRQMIIKDLRAQKLETGRGQDCTATITKNVLPRPTDWDRIYAWVKKTGAFEIFERRISKSAFKERLDAGEGIPGIDAFEFEDLSLTKAAKK